jgi:hypothetical protein
MRLFLVGMVVLSITQSYANDLENRYWGIKNQIRGATSKVIVFFQEKNEKTESLVSAASNPFQTVTAIYVNPRDVAIKHLLISDDWVKPNNFYKVEAGLDPKAIVYRSCGSAATLLFDDEIKYLDQGIEATLGFYLKRNVEADSRESECWADFYNQYQKVLEDMDATQLKVKMVEVYNLADRVQTDEQLKKRILRLVRDGQAK